MPSAGNVAGAAVGNSATSGEAPRSRAPAGAPAKIKAWRAERAAADLAGLHSSDPTTVVLSTWARVRGFEAADLEAALYEERSLLRMLVMRRTLFVVPRALAGPMDVACARANAAAERRRLARMLGEQGVSRRPERWIAETEEQVLEALANGERSAPELTAVVPRLGKKLTFGEGSRWQAEVGVSTRILFLLAG